MILDAFYMQQPNRTLLTKTDIDRLNMILGKMKKVADNNGQISDLVPLDNDFHDILFSKIDNDLIVELCRRSCQGISKFLLYKHWIKLFSTEQVYQRHKKIIEALSTKDPHIIESILREHYFESGEKMSKYGVDIMEK
ncbi:MAG: FCD domain-containing protein [Desulfobacter sp.]|nr:FCD domain-containing protein [Desulfobacter sp.]